MERTARIEQVCSKPTMCLGCHLVVAMVHEGDADPIKGAWTCPRCGRNYPFAHWKIRKQTLDKSKIAA